MTMNIVLFLLGALLTLVACTNQEIYEATQKNRQQECQKLPTSAAIEQCMEQYKEPYEDYERKRKEL